MLYFNSARNHYHIAGKTTLVMCNTHHLPSFTPNSLPYLIKEIKQKFRANCRCEMYSNSSRATTSTSC